MRIGTVNRNRTRLYRSEVAWNQAITDAKQKLQMAEERAKRLKDVVTDLEAMKNSGQLWPGIDAGTKRESVPA